jgi:hypothetical protein
MRQASEVGGGSSDETLPEQRDGATFDQLPIRCSVL